MLSAMNPSDRAEIKQRGHSKPARSAVVLVNLGTPDAPTPPALKRYLREFLSDPRIVELPRALWWLILNGVILNVRPRRSAKAYASVWTEQGSPLMVHSKAIASAVDAELKRTIDGEVLVRLAMRYGNPSMASVLDELTEHNVRRLLVLPLYPQYSATTTASIFDAVSSYFQRQRWIPELRFVTDYFSDSAHIDALTEQVRAHRAIHGPADQLIFSFHGIPKRYLLNGDPYHCQCLATARHVAEALKLRHGTWRVAFQSRFGREEWLRPYLTDVLKELPKHSVRSVQVICPGFAADCLETLEEIAVEAAHTFQTAGGERFEYIPALNANPTHIQALGGLIRRKLLGWPELDPGFDLQAERERLKATLKRAEALERG
jgi:protoporphyrin/coproporphyrin ferrochelatase